MRGRKPEPAAPLSGHKALAAALIQQTLADLALDPAACEPEDIQRKAEAYHFVADEESSLGHFVALLGLTPEAEQQVWDRLFAAQAAAAAWQQRRGQDGDAGGAGE